MDARDHTIATVRRFLDAGKKVLLVYPVPEMGWDVPTYLAKRAVFGGQTLSKSDGSIRHALYQKRNAEIIETLDAIGNHAKLVRIRPDALFCDGEVKGRCVAHVDGKPLYFDDDHVSHFGAERIAQAVAPHLLKTSPN